MAQQMGTAEFDQLLNISKQAYEKRLPLSLSNSNESQLTADTALSPDTSKNNVVI